MTFGQKSDDYSQNNANILGKNFYYQQEDVNENPSLSQTKISIKARSKNPNEKVHQENK